MFLLMYVAVGFVRGKGVNQLDLTKNESMVKLFTDNLGNVSTAILSLDLLDLLRTT